MSAEGGFAWRKWNRILHRDLGYLAVGLTIIYSVSGIAVNHVSDWNPNYYQDVQQGRLDPSLLTVTQDDSLASIILKETGFDSPLKNTYRPSPQEFRLFLRHYTIDINLTTGNWQAELEQPRFLLHFFNFLHLNHAKEIWTWIADLFALVLIFLAISGLFMIKGPKGIRGRGAWLTLLGILVPLVIAWIYYN
ncbi:MAG: PepSY-associated TM helix domain-containing protein [Bacteroidetes bacterium]|nr:PepSY-associated TM helix domain-containing protein [Bacteroidota bacterium]